MSEGKLALPTLVLHRVSPRAQFAVPPDLVVLLARESDCLALGDVLGDLVGAYGGVETRLGGWELLGGVECITVGLELTGQIVVTDPGEAFINGEVA